MPTTENETSAATVAALSISLSGIADLARVQRPVVSMWRSRFADTDTPFPAPVGHRGGHALFDAHAVARWLADTRHGNNPDPIADAALAAEGTTMDASDPAHVAEVAALITLRALTGYPLAGIAAPHAPATPAQPALARLLAEAHRLDPDDRFLLREITTQVERGAPWLGYVDALVDASFSPTQALSHLTARAARIHRAQGSSGPVGAGARAIVTALVRAMTVTDGHPTIRLVGAVDEALFTAMAGDDDDVDVVVDGEGSRRALRRHVRCASPAAPLGDIPTFLSTTVARFPTTAGATNEALLADIDEFALGLTPFETAIVVAPARALTDRLPHVPTNARADTVRTGRVRAIIRLGAGEVSTASREALAIWVLGEQAEIPLADRVVAVADLTDATVTPAAVDDLVSDVLANMAGPVDARAHAFRFARLRRTSSLLAASDGLVTDASPRPRPRADTRAELSARLEASIRAADSDAPSIDPRPLARADGVAPGATTLADAIAARHVRVIPGTRLDEAEFGDTGLQVITAADLDAGAGAGGPAPAGPDTARIDPLAFAENHPNATLTQPGDVVFRTSPTARGWVDQAGSNIVSAPARVLRISTADPGGLVPELVAADIATGIAGPSAWRRWRLRRVTPSQRAALRAALAEASVTRAALVQRIAALDELTAVLSDAVAEGAVALTDNSNDRPLR